MNKSKDKIINLKVIVERMLAEKKAIDHYQLLGDSKLVNKSKKKIQELNKELDSLMD
ncbi:hypothetical protein ACOLNO_002955 [Vibrio parahaemolyticus]